MQKRFADRQSHSSLARSPDIHLEKELQRRDEVRDMEIRI